MEHLVYLFSEKSQEKGDDTHRLFLLFLYTMSLNSRRSSSNDGNYGESTEARGGTFRLHDRRGKDGAGGGVSNITVQIQEHTTVEQIDSVRGLEARRDPVTIRLSSAHNDRKTD